MWIIRPGRFHYLVAGHCQVDEKLVERPSRYWDPVRRERVMLGIKKTAVSFNLTKPRKLLMWHDQVLVPNRASA